MDALTLRNNPPAKGHRSSGGTQDGNQQGVRAKARRQHRARHRLFRHVHRGPGTQHVVVAHREICLAVHAFGFRCSHRLGALDAALVDWEIEKLLKVLPLMLPFIKVSTWLKMRFKRGS